MGCLAGAERCPVVAARFPLPGAERSGTVDSPVHNERRAMEAPCEIRTYRSRYHHKLAVLPGLHAYLRRSGEQHRAEVQGGTCLVRRHEIHVLLQCQQYRLAEQRLGYGCHTQSLCRALHTPCVVVHTEYAHFAVHTAKGFQSLEHTLPVLYAC